MKHIPKRPLIPIITDLLEYRQAAGNTIPYATKIVEKYGDVCESSFTGIKNYFIHDPEVIKEILTTQSSKMKRTSAFRAFRKFLGDGLFTSDGDYHRRQRKLIKPAFYPQRIKGYADIMVSCTVDEMNTWNDGDVININSAMTRITLQIITKAMFGAELEQKVIDDVRENLSAAFDVMNTILKNPLYVVSLEKEIKLPIVSKFFALKANLDKVINNIISSYRKAGDANRSDLLTLLLEARDEETGVGMTDEQIRDEVITFFLAGHETTTIAITWTWYMLGKHPSIANQFYDEIRTKIKGRLPNADDYQSLSFTKNVFKESLRLYPPAWTFARETTEDIVIQDYHFPKGSVLWTITYLVHHNEKYFHEADSFIPSRWDEEKIKEMPRYAYSPFGGGNRMCIGEGFAWMEGVLVLATIASRFKLQLPDNFSVEIKTLFTLKTSRDVLMKAEKIQ